MCSQLAPIPSESISCNFRGSVYLSTLWQEATKYKSSIINLAASLPVSPQAQ